MKSIQSKITATYLGLAVLILAGAGILSSSRIESFFKSRLADDLGRQADLIITFLEKDSSLSFAQLDSLVRKISGIEGLRVTLINADGRVIADSDVPAEKIPFVENHLNRPEVQKALGATIGADTRQSATVGREFLYVAKALPASLSGGSFRNLKFVRLSMPLETVEAEIQRIRLSIIAAGIVVLSLTTVISIVVSRRLSRPMVHIAKSLERIRLGDLNERVNVGTKDEIGQVAGAVNELVDKLKADIVQLQKLERVRSEFLANVSHELRTPIFAIQGFLETLLNGAMNDPSVNKSFLEKASANAQRLNALLADLIDISRIESGEMRMSFRYFRLNEFLENIVKDFQPTARQLGIELELNLKTPTKTEAYGDRDRLQQVMSNLIENGLRYNKKGGTVTVLAEPLNGDAKISVSDTGVGIAAEHLPRIFERFYRVDKDRSREVGGTGLGLAIVKHIIEAHNSKVEVESEPTKGSTFWFTLKTA
jgi:two-component system phosphate regulon sensor histidine kinase PhoR